MSFRDRLRAARNAKGYKQTELSEMIGLSKNAVSNYENGTSNPNVEVLYKLFEVLDIDPNYLFQDEVPIQSISVLPNEKKMLTDYRELNEIGQQKAQEYIRLLLMDSSYKKLPPLPQEEEYAIAAWGGKNEVKTKTIKPQTT